MDIWVQGQPGLQQFQDGQGYTEKEPWHLYTCSNMDETEGWYIDESSQRQKNSETEKSSVEKLEKGREEEVRGSLAKNPNQEDLILVFYSIVDELG